jgi:hypothetical protein
MLIPVLSPVPQKKMRFSRSRSSSSNIFLDCMSEKRDIVSKVMMFLHFKTMSKLRVLNKAAARKEIFPWDCGFEKNFKDGRVAALAFKALKTCVIEKLAELISVTTVEFKGKLFLCDVEDIPIREYIYTPVGSEPDQPLEHLHRHVLGRVVRCSTHYRNPEKGNGFMVEVILDDCRDMMGLLTLVVVDCRPTSTNRLRSGH